MHAFSKPVVTAAFLVLLLMLCGCNARSANNHGRILSLAAPAKKFSIVIVPDTQCYLSARCRVRGSGNPEFFYAQTRWIAANKDALNIAAVISVGDIAHCPFSTDDWQKAEKGYEPLESANIPYLTVPGNHDYDSGDCKGEVSIRRTSAYNKSFGLARYSRHSWFGQSTFPSGTTDNAFITFSAGGNDYLVVGLELFPRNEALQWAESVIRSHPKHQVILATHAFLEADGKRATGLDEFSADGNTGKQMWNRYLKHYPNLVAVVNGHYFRKQASRRTDIAENGNIVAQMFSNYQVLPDGGGGYLRVLTFRTGEMLMDVKTYSPYLDRYMADDDNQFTIAYGQP